MARAPNGTPDRTQASHIRTGVVWQRTGMRLISGDTFRSSAEWPRERIAMTNCDRHVPSHVDVALQVSRMQPAWRAEWEVLPLCRGGQGGILVLV